MLSSSFFKGMAMGGGLIIAIGAQNAFYCGRAYNASTCCCARPPASR